MDFQIVCCDLTILACRSSPENQNFSDHRETSDQTIIKKQNSILSVWFFFNVLARYLSYRKQHLVGAICRV